MKSKPLGNNTTPISMDDENEIPVHLVLNY